jgi:hypothetical protein
MNTTTTVPAPAPDFEAPAITDCNLYVLVALGGLPALKAARVPEEAK